MSNNLKTYECFYCDELFSEAQALESGVSLEEARSYCSSECETRDKAEMAQCAIAQLEGSEEQAKIDEKSSESRHFSPKISLKIS